MKNVILILSITFLTSCGQQSNKISSLANEVSPNNEVSETHNSTELKLNSHQDSVSFAIGMSMGMYIRNQLEDGPFEINNEIMAKGFLTSANREKSLITEEFAEIMVDQFFNIPEYEQELTTYNQDEFIEEETVAHSISEIEAPSVDKSIVIEPQKKKYTMKYSVERDEFTFADSKGMRSLSCNTNTEAKSFTIRPMVRSNGDEAYCDELLLDVNGVLTTNSMTFQSITGEKITYNMISYDMTMNSGNQIIRLARGMKSLGNRQFFSTEFIDFLSSKPIEKIMIEDVDRNEWSVQGVSNPNFFIELMDAIKSSKIKKQEKL